MKRKYNPYLTHFFNNVIYGSDEDDTLYGNGLDTIYGGNGNDTIIGGPRDDVLSGGRGSDTFTFSRGDGNDVIVDFDSTDKIVIPGLHGWALVPPEHIHPNSYVFYPGGMITLVGFTLEDMAEGQFIFGVTSINGIEI